ncbi:MAG: PKD domain-containing protein [Bacteroidota bacterium]
MKYKGLLKSILALGLILFLGIYFTSCEEEIPAPTLDIFITVDGFSVNIAAEATGATSWYWEYGDGTVSDSVGSHSHMYETGGDFTITCTVTGDGGETTKTEAVTIATIEELLTGGAGAANGKTWVLSRTPGGSDGVGNVKIDLAPDVFPAVSEMLEFIGIPDEYDNEYTFKSDGSYSIDSKNGNVLAGWIYSQKMVDPGDIITTTNYGIFQISLPMPESASWSVTKDTDLTVESVYDPDLHYPTLGVEETVTFENVDYITFEGDGFIGLKDYSSTAIIREISPDRMTLTVFFHSYDHVNDGDKYLKPSLIMTLSYDAK